MFKIFVVGIENGSFDWLLMKNDLRTLEEQNAMNK